MIAHRMIRVRVWLGLEPPPMPEPMPLTEFFAMRPTKPPLLIDRVLHQGCKMVLAGTSKANKTWTLLDMAMSVASGQPWWGHKTTRAKVLYINFELPDWAMDDRLVKLAQARPEVEGCAANFFLWHLRGWAADLSTLRPRLQKRGEDYGLIIVDPAYKLLGDRDENSNSDITSLMNEFERLSEGTGAAVVIAHHFAKGNASGKYAMDRMSGAGAWARDPDSILVMTPHEEKDCFTVSSILRCLPRKEDFVVQWDEPLMKVTDLDPAALRSANTKQKFWTDREFIEKYIPSTPSPRKSIVELGKKDGGNVRTIDRYLDRLSEAGVICSGQGHYWKKDTPENS